MALSPKNVVGVTFVALLLALSSINGEVTEKTEDKKTAGVLLEFVLTATELPGRKGLFGSSGPDTFVVIQYWEKKGDEEIKTYQTSSVTKSSNPEYVNIIRVTFHDGQGQRVKFIVKEKNGNEIGHVSISIKKIVHAEGNKLDLALLGSNEKNNGRLEIDTLIGGYDNVNDDTEERLATKKRKTSTLVDLDKKPKKVKKRRNDDEDEDDD